MPSNDNDEVDDVGFRDRIHKHEAADRPPSDDVPHDLTLAQAARLLGMMPSTLERWAKAGRINSRLSAGGDRIFRRDDLFSSSVRSNEVEGGEK